MYDFVMSTFNRLVDVFDNIIDDWMGITQHRARRVFKDYIPPPHCRWCGQTDSIDACCGGERIPWSRLYSLGLYDEPLSSAILKGKFSKWESGLKYLGRMLGNQVKGSVPRGTVVTPVPMPFIRKFTRGIHHSSVIAHALARRAKLPCRMLLWKRNGQTQAGQSETARHHLQLKSMNVLPWAKIEGKHILLVDDVYTTGRTLRVAVKHLRDARARSIRVAVIAVTKMPRKG